MNQLCDACTDWCSATPSCHLDGGRAVGDLHAFSYNGPARLVTDDGTSIKVHAALRQHITNLNSCTWRGTLFAPAKASVLNHIAELDGTTVTIELPDRRSGLATCSCQRIIDIDVVLDVHGIGEPPSRASRRIDEEIHTGVTALQYLLGEGVDPEDNQ
jgi:hypothetical protein